MDRKILNIIFFILFLTLTILKVQGQSIFSRPTYLTIDADQNTKDNILKSLDTLFSQIDNGKLDTNSINKGNYKLTIATLTSLKGIENNDKDSIINFYKRQLINLYPISTTEYFISVVYVGHRTNEAPILKTIFNLVAKNENEKFIFSLPISYLTKTWKTKVVGNVTYHFSDNINFERAKLFDKKNISIAKKLNLKPEKFNFYLCDNYQEVLHLLGYEYDLESNGKTRDGYGVDANTIFSIMHNEDFSHDLFHYYSAKVRTNKRNGTAEEGIAYSWGNTYYTKQNGEIVTQRELVLSLKKYLQDNPQTSLIDLFDKKPKIFNDLAKEVSVKSTLSSLICDEIEKKKGIKGIKLLLNCGSGDDNYFKCVDGLVQINRTNFDKEVMKLVEAYK